VRSAIAPRRPVARLPPDRYIVAAGRESRPCGSNDEFMRAEIEKLLEEIKQSVGLLRRHL